MNGLALPPIDYSQRLHRVIPSGAHTYSRADFQFPANAPQILKGGRECYVVDNYGRTYLDYGMGLRAVGIGYAEPEIVEAALDGMLMGNCLTRPSILECEAAELACSILGFDMVKFCKNGSTATTAAVKLARAATDRNFIMCANQPFFSYDDWFIGATERNLGTDNFCDKAHIFNSIEQMQRLIDPKSVACIIMEPKDYDLVFIRSYCDKHGIILIFDEMCTGFRYHGWSKAQHDGVKPDLSCFGKAMANGFSVACVGGKREIMEIGARDDFFFCSTTHGAEMSGLAAFMATAEFYRRHKVSKYLSDYLKELLPILPGCVGGSVYPLIEKTLFMQEMLKREVLIPYVSPCYRHTEKELKFTKAAVDGSLETIAGGVTLEGPRIKPVFS
jgi:glutamate-1-semialdehyde 2,1-aminomutase